MQYNYNYGKLIEETVIEYAPINALARGVWYCPAPDDVLESLLYKKVIDTPFPDDGKQYTFTWHETSSVIEKVWTPIPDPQPEPLTPAQQRELAYETELICPWGNGLYTVDYMNDLWAKYSAEGNEEIASEIQEIIAAAKADIRQRYPDD